VPSTNGERTRVQVDPEVMSAATLLARDVPVFLREGVNLARLEARATVKDLGLRASLVSASLYAAAVGFFFLCVGLSFLVSEALETSWAGPIVVGGGVFAVGLAVVPVALKAGGKKRPDESAA
jgi:hypothetical protein